MAESEKTTLTLLGDLGAFGGVALALALGALAWWLYWQESRTRPGAARWMLPTLRAAAIMLVVLILTGPVLRHEHTVRHLGKVTVLVDASRSMTLSDPGIPTARKVALLAAMDRLPDEPFFVSARESGAHLRQARDLANEMLAAGTEQESTDLPTALADFVALLDQAQPGFFRLTRDAYTERGGSEADRSPEQISSDYLANLVQPARDLLERSREMRNSEQRVELLRDLRQLLEPLALVLMELELAVGAHVERRAAAPESDGDRVLASALREFDEMTRWQRVEDLLLGDENGLVARLRETQDVDLIALVGPETETLWWQARGGAQSSGPLPPHLTRLPDASMTDLTQPLLDALGGEAENRAMILLSDGQHNTDGSPELVARQLGELGVPLFAIGVGAEESPPDLAITAVLVPEGIYLEDQLRGEIMINDQMPAGGAYEVLIEHNGQLIWEDFFQADGSGERSMEFQFPVRELVEAEIVRDPLRAADMRNLPLDFRVIARQLGVDQAGEVDPARVETILDNNERDFRVQALTRKRRLLLLDGRPRWESRYLHNLFDRDERWEVNPLYETIDPAGDRDWQRGDGFGEFPAGREELLAYDLIIFGDVPGDALSSEEAGWIAEFVGQRGGGLVFIDGQRGFLRDLPHSRLTDLLPVEPLSGDAAQRGMPEALELTPEGRDQLALRIDERPGMNSATWESLLAPRWAAPVQALPGATTLARARFGGDDAVDTMVWHRYGAGRVLYLGVDELWRWRFDVADRYFQTFWIQVANWVGEPPFAVEGPRVAIATDRLAYDDGDQAELRVRLRDTDGRFLDNAELRAEFLLDDETSVEIALQPDPNGGGIYRGRTGALPPGEYEVRIRESGLEPFDSAMSFVVRERPDLEMEALTMNKPLLMAVSDSSGGEFLLEEHATRVLDRLAAIDRRETITTDTVLWSSYWWFVPIILLLTLEWVIRKSAGYV